MTVLPRPNPVSFVVIVTLALGVGLTTAIFSVVHGVLLKPLPYPAAERLVWMGESTGRANGISVTWPNFASWRAGNHSFEQLAAFQYTQATLTGRGEARLLRGLSVTHEYLPLLGVQPLLGRLVADRDDRPAAPAAVVLSHRFWSGSLGADPAIVGTVLSLDGRPCEVIGVAAPVWEISPVDFYQALGRIAGAITDRSQHGSIRVLGRLKPAVTVAAARADIDGIMARLALSDPGPENEHRGALEILAERTTGSSRSTLLALMGAAGLVLLIACANVASLLLARGTTRTTEFAVRAALGAGRGRLARQLLGEHLVLAGIGGGAGIVLAYWARAALVAAAPVGIPRLAETAIDRPVLLFALGLSVATGLLFGIAPIVTAARVDVTSALKAGGRAVTGDGTRQYARSLLVVSEVALTFVLAFGASLLLRSLAAAEHASPGVDAAHVLSLHLRLPASYRGSDAITAFSDRLGDAVRTIPGVVAASAVRCPPGAGDCGDWFYSVPGRPIPARNEVPIALTNAADPGYFKTMGVAVRQGREFTAADRAGGQPVAIVNETFARRWWPSEPAIGQQIKLGGPYIDGPVLEVVGVAADITQGGLDSQAEPEIFQPRSQKPDAALALMIRAAGDPEALIPQVRQAVATLDPNLPVQRVEALERTLDASLGRRRFSTMLLAGFAGLAVLLAAIGIYGLLSYWVSVREREIAIRLALGAPIGTIVRWTSAQALRLAAIGMVVGSGAAWVLARTLDDLVFGIPLRSPASLVVPALAVAAVAALAAAIPSWRAARVDAAAHLHQ